MADLAAYRPVWRRPLAGSFGGHALRTNCPPSSGGVLIAYMLAVLAAARPAGEPGSASALRALAETMRAAARLRGAGVRPPAAPRRSGRPRAGSGGGRGGAAERRPGARGRPVAAAAIPSDHGTTHISVVDGQGNAVGFTASNGSHSGVSWGTGLHLEQHAGRGGLRRRSPPGAGQPPDQHAGADDGRARRPAAAGRRVERLEPTALGDHAGDRERRPARDVTRGRGVVPPRSRRGRPARLRGGIDAAVVDEAPSEGRAAGHVRRAEPLLRRRERRVGQPHLAAMRMAAERHGEPGRGLARRDPARAPSGLPGHHR